MALFGHGGRSRPAGRSTASTRPPAARGHLLTRIDRRLRTASSRSRSSAVSDGISPGCLPAAALRCDSRGRRLFPEVRDEVARAMTGVQLLDEDAAFPGSAAGVGGPAEPSRPGCRWKARPGPCALDGEMRMSASEICRNSSPKAVHLLVQQAGHRFRGAVAAGETGAAGDRHDLHAISAIRVATCARIRYGHRLSSTRQPGWRPASVRRSTNNWPEVSVSEVRVSLTVKDGDVQRHECRFGLVAHGVGPCLWT